MTDIPCTRIPEDPANQVNPLMVPPCHCPRCSAEPEEVRLRAADTFLRVSGRRQRLRVEPLDLGPRGRAVLGG